MKLADLAPHPKNPRKITDQKLKQLAKSLHEFGDLSGIVFNRQTERMVGGHQRTKALPPDAEVIIEKRYGPPTRTGTVAEGYATIDGERYMYREVMWDDIREKAANIAANKGAGEWDLPQLSEWLIDLDAANFDMDLTMFDDKELENLMAPITKLPAEGDEDDVPAVPVEPRSKRGDLYQLGNHRLLCGDSTMIDDVEKLMAGEKAELCFTSPPYADQREYNGGKELSTEHLATFIRAAYGRAQYFAVNLGYSRKDGEVNPYWDAYIKEAKGCGLKLLSWNVWHKGECGSIGNQTAMFGICHEWIFVFGLEAKDLNRTVPNISAGELANHNGNRQRDGSIKKQKDRIVSDFSQLKTVYECVPQKERDEIDHPARFPIRFPEGYIEAMTSGRDAVYEPFSGSGSTLIACEKTGRRCFGMEIDPHYVDVIVSRFCKYAGVTKVVLNGEVIDWAA